MELNHLSSRGGVYNALGSPVPSLPVRSSVGSLPFEVEEGEGVEPSTQRSARLSRPVAHHRAPPSVMVRAVGFEPTASCFQGRSSGRAELHPVEKLALRREIESLSPDRQSGRLTRCVTELDNQRSKTKLVRLGRLERPLNALSTHSLCRLGYRRISVAVVGRVEFLRDPTAAKPVEALGVATARPNLRDCRLGTDVLRIGGPGRIRTCDEL